MRLIIDIPKGEYDKICKTMLHTNSGNPNFYFESKIANGTPIPDNATPCDFCRYNPPSSTDGKPCCMCPATGRSK